MLGTLAVPSIKASSPRTKVAASLTSRWQVRKVDNAQAEEFLLLLPPCFLVLLVLLGAACAAACCCSVVGSPDLLLVVLG